MESASQPADSDPASRHNTPTSDLSCLPLHSSTPPASHSAYPPQTASHLVFQPSESTSNQLPDSRTHVVAPAAIPVVAPVLAGISIAHLLNDSIQAVIPAIFPILHHSLHFSYAQLGMIAFANNITASLMQPLVGWWTDKRQMPFLLPMGMLFTLVGMLVLAFSATIAPIVCAVMLVGLGSAVFHPEGSRIVKLSSGSRNGLGQSLFQAGGNAGNALAPLLTLAIFAPMGLYGAVWFVAVAALAAAALFVLARWHKKHSEHSEHNEHNEKTLHAKTTTNTATTTLASSPAIPPAFQRQILNALLLLVMLVFVRAWLIAGMSSFYALYQMKIFGISLKAAQTLTFTFLIGGSVGTIFGGFFADRFGKQRMLLLSMAASAALAWAMPLLNGASAGWAGIGMYFLLGTTGFCVSTGFPMALLYAMELMPTKTGTMAGLMFGVAFGMGALGAAVMGAVADALGIQAMMIGCCLLPLLGLAAALLPSDATVRSWHAAA
jgi:MFS transporter, FSR family, fosmidomycin resistance protein